MIRARTVLLGFVVVAATSAGTAAFTDNITGQPPSQVVGYGTTTISGGAGMDSLSYTYNADGTNITAVTVVMIGDLRTGYTVKGAFNASALTTCVAAGALDGNGNTPFTCTIVQNAAGANAFHVAVTSN
jgi:hypothetical protein